MPPEYKKSPRAVERGEFFLVGNGTVTTITTVNKNVAFELGAGNHLKDWTFQAGSNGVITDTADNGGTLRITDVAHGLTTGDIVTINGLATAAQNAVTAITKIDDDTFDADDIAYVTASETGTWQSGAALIAPTGRGGDYQVMFSASLTPAGANKTFQFHIYQGATEIGDLTSERKFSASDIGSIGMSGIVTVSVAAHLWLSIIGLTDATNITIKHLNLSLHRT